MVSLVFLHFATTTHCNFKFWKNWFTLLYSTVKLKRSATNAKKLNKYHLEELPDRRAFDLIARNATKFLVRAMQCHRAALLGLPAIFRPSQSAPNVPNFHARATLMCYHISTHPTVYCIHFLCCSAISTYPTVYWLHTVNVWCCYHISTHPTAVRKVLADFAVCDAIAKLHVT